MFFLFKTVLCIACVTLNFLILSRLSVTIRKIDATWLTISFLLDTVSLQLAPRFTAAVES